MNDKSRMVPPGYWWGHVGTGDQTRRACPPRRRACPPYATREVPAVRARTEDCPLSWVRNRRPARAVNRAVWD